MARGKSKNSSSNNSADIGFEAKLWRAANFAKAQHFVHPLAPTGMADFVLANGSISSNQSGEIPSNRLNT
jgi:hypothetical protein